MMVLQTAQLLVASLDSVDVCLIVGKATHPVVVRVIFFFARAAAEDSAVRAVQLTAAVAGLVLVVARVFHIAGVTPVVGKSGILVGGGELVVLVGGGTDGGTSDGAITGSAFLFSFGKNLHQR